jgi:hypothetical protein
MMSPSAATLQLDLALRDARHVEQVVDEPHEVRELPRDELARRLDRRDLLGVPGEQVNRAHHRRQGIAQLVRQHREELVFSTVALFELGDEARAVDAHRHLIDDDLHQAQHPLVDAHVGARAEGDRADEAPVAEQRKADVGGEPEHAQKRMVGVGARHHVLDDDPLPSRRRAPAHLGADADALLRVQNLRRDA